MGAIATSLSKALRGICRLSTFVLLIFIFDRFLQSELQENDKQRSHSLNRMRSKILFKINIFFGNGLLFFLYSPVAKFTLFKFISLEKLNDFWFSEENQAIAAKELLEFSTCINLKVAR